MELKFGKHKGEDLDDVPTDYLKWLLENMEPQKGNFDNRPLLKECQLQVDSREKHGEAVANEGINNTREAINQSETDSNDGFKEPPAF